MKVFLHTLAQQKKKQTKHSPLLLLALRVRDQAMQ
jgi:hypothetical protein